mmetsp:Transcript_10504/g.26440  ORF Transcript_10504/g.26440 Transcript_10504/m.26440 type:complete len:231 (+) Transcript_10504:953-1645(+)
MNFNAACPCTGKLACCSTVLHQSSMRKLAVTTSSSSSSGLVSSSSLCQRRMRTVRLCTSATPGAFALGLATHNVCDGFRAASISVRIEAISKESVGAIKCDLSALPSWLTLRHKPTGSDERSARPAAICSPFLSLGDAVTSSGGVAAFAISTADAGSALSSSSVEGSTCVTGKPSSMNTDSRSVRTSDMGSPFVGISGSEWPRIVEPERPPEPTEGLDEPLGESMRKLKS